MFKIDFFELSILATACIPPAPIARTMFFQNLTDVYYKQLTEEQRFNLYSYINRELAMEYALKDKNEECLMFNARFDPNNQYVITTFTGEKIECYKWNDNYNIARHTRIGDEFIQSVKKL